MSGEGVSFILLLCYFFMQLPLLEFPLDDSSWDVVVYESWNVFCIEVADNCSAIVLGTTDNMLQ